MEKKLRSYLVQESKLPVNWNEIGPLGVDYYLWLHNGYQPKVEVKLCFTDERLHIRFQVYEENPLIRCNSPGDPVYKDSCVEFFIQPLPDSDARYLNFELNAAGVLLLQLGEGREQRIPLAQDSTELFQIKGDLHVNAGQTTGENTCWTLEFSIPFAWLQSLFPDFTVASGQILRGNFYKCGDETDMPHYGCWNRVDSASPNFHLSSCFGELKFQ
ncbi:MULTISPECIES: carbohydrate-binding family 9-like protein [unclassified Paenibacillus]|uniref:carbohydrate-binding family 9-like protein n=1 Tax=unclassified Paenibacillus TaxID=185978 RepID=UPI00096F61D7|nr:carbohydrate-binding family 9-like protein [Paenibacillus sp. FSL H8-0259]OMF32939.1 hypothetical protein BK132_01505 [Paenibacillus sp. FSL H8-0259]